MALSSIERASMLSVQQLRTFCGVYERRGYSAAADQLGLAVPTMWEQIKALEKTYQTKLFERQGRNVAATSAADGLYRLVLPILASLQSSFEIVEEHGGRLPDQVTIVTGVRMMLEDLGPPLRQFQTKYPDVRLRLMHADNQTAQQRVLDEEVDMALLLEPPPAFVRRGLVYERLYSLDALAVLPRRHRLAKAKRLKLSDLIGEPLIVGNTNTVGRRLLEHAMFREGLLGQMRVAAETDNSAAIIACVRARLGIGVIAGQTEGNLLVQVVAKSLRHELGRTYVVAAINEGRQPTELLNDLLTSLRAIDRD